MRHDKHYHSNHILGMAGTGAVIGGTGAAAANLRKVIDHERKPEEAMGEIVRETLGTAAATATATAVVDTLEIKSKLVRLLGTVAVAIGAKYLIDGVMNPKKPAAEKVPPEAVEEPEKEKQAPESKEKVKPAEGHISPEI